MGKEKNVLRGKIGEIRVKKGVVFFTAAVYAVLGALALTAGILYCQTLEEWFPNFKVIGYGPYLLSAVFFTFMIYFSSFRRRTIELYEEGFVCDGKTYLWKELAHPAWKTRAYPLLGFLPTPFGRVREFRVIPTDRNSPVLSEVYLEDLYDRFRRAWEGAEK